MDLSLLVPIAAITAFFGMIALAVRSLIVGRTLRRLEDQLHQGGGSAVDASLERVRQLQARAAVSTGAPTPARAITVGLIALLAFGAVMVGGWMILRGDGNGGETPAAQTETDGNTQEQEPAPSTDGDDPAPADTGDGGDDGTDTDDPGIVDAQTDDGTDPAVSGSDSVPTSPPELVDKAQYTVAIFNATDVNGAAGEKTRPRIELAGYSIGTIGDSPDGRQDLQRSVVMWPPGKQEVAWNVAKDLGVSLAPALDGFTEAEVGSADAIVFVGFDLANG